MVTFGPFAGVCRDDVEAINTIAAFLAEDDQDAAADVVVLAGNEMVWTLEGAAARARAMRVPLLISGGVGHSTERLQRFIAEHPRYRTIPQAHGTEAALLRDVAVAFLGLPCGQVIAECRSANCGENARFSKEALAAAGIRPSTLMLVQDPLMQRRTAATFRHAWAGEAGPAIVSWPVWRPQVAIKGDAVGFFDPPGPGLWTPLRFMELLFGEVARLRDDEHGYGPRGRGFIPHVDIPPTVEDAFRHLTACERFACADRRLRR